MAGDGRIGRGSTDVVWLHGNGNWYPHANSSLLEMSRTERPKVICRHTEPLPLPESSGIRPPFPTLAELVKIAIGDARATDPRTNARHISRMWRHGIPDLLIVSTTSRKSYLAERGIDAHFVPAAYSPAQGRDLGLKRDIPALFIGIVSDPRHRSAVRYLRKRGIEVAAHGDWKKEAGLWGGRRTEMINRAKTFLALQRNPRELSGVRMILGMANKALVISEPIHQPDPFVPGTHYVSAPLTEMADVIRYYNDNEDEARRIADAGHHLVTTELTFEKQMKQILDIAGLA